MIWIYRLLYFPLFLISLPFYARRMIKRGGYSKDFSHRFGCIGRIPKKKEGRKRVWLQAVSVGELLGIAPVLEALASEGVEIYLTTTTSTGYELAKKIYGKQCLAIRYFPFDFWFFSAAIWRKVRPDVAILMECELWPEHLHQAERRDVPIVLTNARMSDRSFERYSAAGFLGAHLLGYLNTIIAASKQDFEKFNQIGASAEDIQVSGNLKFDVEIEPRLNREEIRNLKAELGFINISERKADPLIVLGSSTWPGEEAALLLFIEQCFKANIPCRLLIVPRHAERRAEIEALLETQELPYHFRSKSKQAKEGTMIYVADTTGELKILTQVADVAFIGKSLLPNRGGQTPIEAAALGVPIIFGPNMDNFREITNSLVAAGAARKALDANEMREIALDLIQDEKSREQLSASAKAWHRSNQGATEKTLEIIRFYLDS